MFTGVRANRPLPVEVPTVPTLDNGVHLIEAAQVLLGNNWRCPTTSETYSLEEALGVWRTWCADPQLRNIVQHDKYFSVRFLRRYTGDLVDYEARWIDFFTVLQAALIERSRTSTALPVL